HSNCFGSRNLHVIDPIAIPNRLEETVPEPEHHDVLDGFLSEKMIYAVDLIFVQNAEYLFIESMCRGQIVPKRLLDHHAAPRSFLLAGETGFTEMLHNRSKEPRRHG